MKEQRTASQPDESQRDLRIRAAWIYYVEGHTQSETARMMGLNRIAVTRLLSEARRRGEVTITIASDLTETVTLERDLEERFGLEKAIVAPFSDAGGDPTNAIAAIAGPYISSILRPNMTLGVGWGRTLHATLSHLRPRAIEGLRVVSLLGGIAEARRFNPAEFAWQFAEAFDAEGFLVPAPALVDSPATRHALLEHCGIEQVFQQAESSDVALISCGGIDGLTTSYRIGHIPEPARRSLKEAGAIGDILYNFVDASGALVEHGINERCVSMPLERLQRIPSRILMSGGVEKDVILRAALASVRPTTIITDEASARRLLDGSP
ncbi:sugar-binding transcriptional regulator [Jannaschia aquimarina]|uniref:DeoR_1 protein n=1 Tax=Jannaschia aquimarina TaxID=935700 RepID=A0A0D1EIK2_9RHOB|nr:sugar-binding transcriptional regulator [Jannaschia aquimarina]KIT17454.1 Deoxyribonucleoside regulator [Jannaschia aquimarina]SNS75675.1 transcriptional regulator [Jannaschia aquimarina]